MMQGRIFKTNDKEKLSGVGVMALSLFLLAGSGQVAVAADGDLDPTFGIGGKEMIEVAADVRDFAQAVAIQPDGKILVGGDLGDFGSYSNSAVLMRLHPNGSLDPSFGSGGKVISNFQRHLAGIVLQPDGKILTAGGIPATYGVAFAVSRYNSDGSLDQSFGNGGFATIGPQSATIVVSDSTALALQPDGKIVVVGYASINPGGERFLLARFNADGGLDESFGNDGSVFTVFTNGSTRALTVALQADGKIVAAGFNVADQRTRNFALARYNTDGSLDLDFGLEGMVTTNFSLHNFAMAFGIVLQPDGKIVAVGGFTQFSDGFLLARYKDDGRLDQTFGAGGKVTNTFGSGFHGHGHAVTLQADGKILAAGSISPGSDVDFAMARYNPDGSFDQSFGHNGFITTPFTGALDEGNAFARQADGKIVLAGYAAEPGASYHDFALARYVFDAAIGTPTPTPTPEPTATPGATSTPTPTPPPEITPTPTPEPSTTPPATPTATAEPTVTPGATPTPSATPESTATPTVTPVPPPQPLNISTRLRVRDGDNALIGGFILTGNDSKEVIIRALGPSLGANGMPGALSDTTLDLYDASGQLLASNDNWKDSNQAQIAATGIAPSDPLESVILTTLTGNSSYTAVVRGKNGATGIGLVEVYDLGLGASSKLANISTRGFVDTGDNVMIGGFIVGGSAANQTRIVVRAIGPSLSGFGLTNALQDPTLSLYDSNGNVLSANDNWQDGHQPEVVAAGLAPTDGREAALFQSLPPGAYTAIVAGRGGTVGVGLVEAYNIQ